MLRRALLAAYKGEAGFRGLESRFPAEEGSDPCDWNKASWGGSRMVEYPWGWEFFRETLHSAL